MAIDAKEAAQIAAKYFESITSQSVKLSIEEIELDDDGSWLITLGMSDLFALGSVGNRVTSYKIFKIDAESGDVIYMKIRTV
ncbi:MULTISPECIES: hypothetical protein [unclassified Endozoicomonas]|uniref:hypothetical protein n=1 Tax=unclassified Endozoicomonas TaxID=2644528 RepID=UPI002148F61C|nr:MULTISPECIES: hypothetical protein [unclassified Endozoicomonas]